MQTFLVLAASAGIAAAVVWRTTVPPVEKVRRARSGVEDRVRTPVGERVRPPRRRGLRRPAAAPGSPRPAAAPARPQAAPRPPIAPAPVEVIPAPPIAPGERGTAQPDVSEVLAEVAVPDARPSRVFTLVRLLFALGFVAVLAVATLAGLWMVVTDRLLGSLGR